MYLVTCYTVFEFFAASRLPLSFRGLCEIEYIICFPRKVAKTLSGQKKIDMSS